MSRVAPNEPCPCGRPDKYKRCCRRYHVGAPAPDPGSLMRARYSAFAVGDLRFVLDTTHPENPRRQQDAARWRAEAEDVVRNARFVGLEVRSETEDGDTGEVVFVATMRRGTFERRIGERARFRREGGRWYYVSGETFEG